MTGAGIVLMLLGTFFQALHGVLQTLLTKKDQLNVFTVRGVLVVNHGLGFIFFLGTLWWWGSFTELTNLITPVHQDNTIFWIAVVWSTGWNIAIQYATAKSRQAADATLATPYQGVTPGLITGSVLLFGEYPTTVALIGIATISLGTYAHGREGVPFRLHAWKEWIKPFRMLFWLPENYELLDQNEKEKTRKNQVGVRWALASAVMGTFGLMGDGIASRHGEITIFYTFYTAVIFMWYLIIPPLWHKLRGSGGKAEAFLSDSCKLGKKQWGLTILLGISYSLIYILVATAYRLAPIAYIGTLKRFQIVLTAILAWWILKERKTRRIATAAIITLGALLVGLDPNPQTRILNSAQDYATALKKVLGIH